MKRIGMVVTILILAFSAILALGISLLSGIPFPTNVQQTHCIFCPNFGDIDFVRNGVLDFLIWFVILSSISGLVLFVYPSKNLFTRR